MTAVFDQDRSPIVEDPPSPDPEQNTPCQMQTVCHKFLSPSQRFSTQGCVLVHKIPLRPVTVHGVRSSSATAARRLGVVNNLSCVPGRLLWNLPPPQPQMPSHWAAFRTSPRAWYSTPMPSSSLVRSISAVLERELCSHCSTDGALGRFAIPSRFPNFLNLFKKRLEKGFCHVLSQNFAWLRAHSMRSDCFTDLLRAAPSLPPRCRLLFECHQSGGTAITKYAQRWLG